MMPPDELSLEEAVESKVDLLVHGIAVDPSVQNLSDSYKPLIQAIYGHYRGARRNFRVPEELLLYCAPEDEKEAIVVRVREHDESERRLIVEDGQAYILKPTGKYKVTLDRKPTFYDQKTSSGTDVWRIVQRMGTDVLGVVASNYCSYFSSQEECRFCELIPSYASARERYPLEVYPFVINVEGVVSAVYHYHLKTHSLELLLGRPFLHKTLIQFNQQWIRSSAVLAVITAIFERTESKYKDRGYRHTLTEYGHMAQNFYLVSTALHLGCCSVGGFIDEGLNEILDINGIDEGVIGVIALGSKAS